jgi:hypothetical protein
VTEDRQPEFKIEARDEETLKVLVLAWFKTRMMACEIAYRQGEKEALMAALQICFGVWLPAGLPPPEWIWREVDKAVLANPKSWDDVFGKPVKSNWERAHTAFSVVQENQGASKGEIVATIADKIGRSEGTARTLYYEDDRLQALTRGKVIADKYELHINDPVWNEHLVYALGLGYLVPVLEEGGNLDIHFYPAGGCGINRKALI